MTGILSEIRHGFRLLRNSAASTVVAVLSLAAGIGANSAIFSVGNAMLLRALAYPDADRLVALRSGNPARGLPDERTAVADLRDWQTQTRSFEAIAGYRWRTVDLTGADRSERLRGLAVTREVFDVFRIRSMIGRTFSGQESRSCRHRLKWIRSRTTWRTPIPRPTEVGESRSSRCATMSWEALAVLCCCFQCARVWCC